MSTVKGVSGLVLLPAKDYEWELKGKHTLAVPVTGKISDLVSAHDLAVGHGVPGDDEFTVMDGDFFSLWELVRVLFATAQYPALEGNECFNVVALEQIVNAKGENIILVHGEIISSLGE